MKKTRLSLIILTLIASQPAVPAEPYATAEPTRLDQAMSYARDTISTIQNYLKQKKWSKREKLALLASLVYLTAALRTAQSQRLRGFRAFDLRRVSTQIIGDVYNTQQRLRQIIAPPLFQ